MTALAYDTIIERTHKLLKEFDEKYNIREAIKIRRFRLSALQARLRCWEPCI